MNGSLRWAIALALCIVRSHIAAGEPFEVAFGGCEVVRVPRDREHPDGIACELWGPSQLEGARSSDSARSGSDQETVTLWTPFAGAHLAVFIDDVWQREVRWVSVSEGGDQGQRARVVVHKPAHQLVVVADHRRRFVLPLVAAEDPDGQRRLREAMDARREGNVERARTLAAELRGSASASLRAKATGLLARLTVPTDVDAAVPLFEEAIAAHRAAGRLSGEVLDTIALAWLRSVQRHELDRGASDLAALEKSGVLASFPEGHAMVPYYRATIASLRGDIDLAYRESAEAEKLLRRLDMQGQLSAVYQQQVALFDQSGYADDDDPAAKLEAESPPEDQPCALAHYYNNLGVHRLNTARRGADPDEHAEAELHLLRAQSYFSAGKCANECERKNVLVNRAHNALDWAQAFGPAGQGSGDDADRLLRDAEHHLQEAAPLCPNGPVRLRSEWSLYSGRLALARSKPPEEAAQQLADAIRWSKAGSLPYRELAALLALAEVTEATDEDRAVRLYRAAEDRLDRWSELARPDGKRAFFAQHAEGVRRYLDLLARRMERSDLPDEERDEGIRHLACVARRSMARSLSSAQRTYRLSRSPERTRPGPLRDTLLAFEKLRARIELDAQQVARLDDPANKETLEALAEQGAAASANVERAVADLAGPPSAPAPSCEEAQALARPGPGEVVLVYHPMRGNEWLGIVLTRDEARLHRFQIGPGELERRAGAPSSPLAPRLLEPFADLLGANEGSRVRIFAAEPVASFDLGPALQRRFLVSHGVDLPPLDGGPPPPRRALVVIPDLEIPFAEEQEKYVRGGLPGWEVKVLSGADATLARLREELEKGVGLLHVYAHGSTDRRHSRDGWASRIVLHGGSWLSVGDVLGLPPVPKVVLAICNGAATRGRSYLQGPSLAHAFLIGGAEQVLASPDEIQDADVDRVMKVLYRHPFALVDDPAAALHGALVEIPTREDWPPPTLRVLSR